MKKTPRESSLLISSELEITPLFGGDFERAETKAPKALLANIIESEFIDSDPLQPNILQFEDPQLTTLVN